jgi:acyl-CoA thioester hydrolase
MKHEIWKNENILAAIITNDGVWLDTGIRKLTRPSQQLVTAFDNISKKINFSFRN